MLNDLAVHRGLGAWDYRFQMIEAGRLVNIVPMASYIKCSPDVDRHEAATEYESVASPTYLTITHLRLCDGKLTNRWTKYQFQQNQNH
jgi:hypothetical protein